MGALGQKYLTINDLLTVHHTDSQIEIISDPTKKLSKNNQKKIQLIKNTTASLLKQVLFEATALIYTKL
jgi:hypothetical protein